MPKQTKLKPKSENYRSLLRDYLRSQQLRYEAEGKVLTSELNQTSRAFQNQLFVTSGSIIALSSPLLISLRTSDKLHVSLSIRLNLVTAVFFGLVSIILGFHQFYIDKKYFQDVIDANTVMVSNLINDEIKSVKDFRQRWDKLSVPPNKSNEKWTSAQFISIGVSIILYSVAASCILLQ
jgi:hypothetical protein